MIQIVLTPEQQTILAQAQEPVELVDNRGLVLGRVQGTVSTEELVEAQRIASEFDRCDPENHGLSENDLARIAKSSAEFRPAVPKLGDLLSRLRDKVR
jgi:hypothetical protein